MIAQNAFVKFGSKKTYITVHLKWQIPTPDKPERIATKALRHQEKSIIKLKLRAWFIYVNNYFQCFSAKREKIFLK
jgi:hypothetical protein